MTLTLEGLDEDADGGYSHHLLRLATDLGDRLMPAFATTTGIPYGTVNLRHGVPPGESEVASTAGAGSLLLEFQTLSIVTGNDRYGSVAFLAMRALFDRRSALGLLGKHIHVQSGRWHESLSGVGSNSDSFYEYLLKAHFLFRKPALRRMFSDVFGAVKKHIQVDKSLQLPLPCCADYLLMGPWFMDVDMFSGQDRRQRLESLAAFWPGIEANMGMLDSSAELLNTMHLVSADQGFLPEEFDYLQWQLGKGQQATYPLRPELAESTYHQYRSTRDGSWLVAGEKLLTNLEVNTRARCGHAVVADILTLRLEDAMPSFFLSETCKYLYLLFDEDNFIHNRDYIFSTEAHPYDASQLRTIERQSVAKIPKVHSGPIHQRTGHWGHDNIVTGSGSDGQQQHQQPSGSGIGDDSSTVHVGQVTAGSNRYLLPDRCDKRYWWDMGTSTYRSMPKTLLDASSSLSLVADQSSPDSLAGETLNVCFSSDNPSRKDLKATSTSSSTEGKDAQTSSTSSRAVESHSRGPPGDLRRGQVHGTGQVCGEEALPDATPTTPSHHPWYGTGGGIADNYNHHDGRDYDSDGYSEGEGVWEENLGAGSAGRRLQEAVRQRYCSIAAFGSTATMPDMGSTVLQAEMTVAADGTGCKVPVSSSRRSSWWSVWRDPIPDSPPTSPKPYQGKVVVVARGGCMFEEKALIAQESGAIGVVIANSEDFVFVMAGKKTTATTNGNKHTTGDDTSNTQSTSSGITIPVVMISSSDLTVLADALQTVSKSRSAAAAVTLATALGKEKGKADEEEPTESDTVEARSGSGSGRGTGRRQPSPSPLTVAERTVPQLRIEITSRPYGLDGLELGHKDYPKVRVGQGMVRALGSGVWAAEMVLSTPVTASAAEVEWQLFLHPRHAMEHKAFSGRSWPLTGRSGSNQDQSMSLLSIALNPVYAYYSILRRQCPRYLSQLAVD
eukprot:gene7884-16140_t